MTHNELIPGDGCLCGLGFCTGGTADGGLQHRHNPTFEGGRHTIEVFLFDFSSDLYGQDVVVHFVEKIRDIIRFPDVAALVGQISADVASARRILAAGLPTEKR